MDVKYFAHNSEKNIDRINKTRRGSHKCLLTLILTIYQHFQKLIKTNLIILHRTNYYQCMSF